MSNALAVMDRSRGRPSPLRHTRGGFLRDASPDARVLLSARGIRALDDDELRALRQVFPSLHIAGLSATPDTLLERARRRALHRELSLPGEDLLGRSEDYLRSIVFATQTLVPDSADLIVETDAVAPDDIAVQIGALWPATP